MKKIVIISVLAFIIAVPGLSTATPIRPGGYFTGFAGATFPSSVDVTGADFVTATPFNDHVKFEPGYYVGGAVGYDLGFIRLEGEVSYKNSDMKSVTDNSTGIPFGSVDGRLGALGFMGNVWFDIHNPSPITPYIGGGAGVAMLDLSSTTGIDFVNGPVLLYPDDHDTVFAYQAGAGIDIAMTRHVSLDLGYRYFGTEKAHFNQNLIAADMKFESHNALLGIRFKF